MTNHQKRTENKVLNKHEKRLRKKEGYLPKKKGKKTKEEKNKQRISIIIIFLMVASVFGVWAVSKQQNSNLSYNKYSFTVGYHPDNQEQKVLFTKVDDKEPFFYYLPQDTLNIPVNGNLTDLFNNADFVVLTYNTSENVAPIYSITRYELSEFSNKQIYGAKNDASITSTLPTITCENATIKSPVIELKTGNETKINIDNNCVIVDVRFFCLFLLRPSFLFP